MTNWYYHEPSQGRVGPIDADTLREHVRSGRVRRDALVWREGMNEWLPLQRMEAELGLDRPAAPPPLPPGAEATPVAAPAPIPAAAPAAAASSPAQGRADFSAALDAADAPRAQAQAPTQAAAPADPAAAAAASADRAEAQRSISPADYAPAHVARRQQHAAPPPKRGMSGCLIALIVVAVLAIPVLGILAAIALPAYQDYTQRAKLAGVLAEAGVYKLQVAEHYLEHEGCPTNTSPGFRPAADYASAQVAGVEFGRFKDSGECAIQVELRGFNRDELDGHKLWLAFDPSSKEWSCSSDVEKAALLPQSCRR